MWFNNSKKCILCECGRVVRADKKTVCKGVGEYVTYNINSHRKIVKISNIFQGTGGDSTL